MVEVIVAIIGALAIILIGYWQFEPRKEKRPKKENDKLNRTEPDSEIAKLATSSLTYLQEMLVEEKKTNLYLRKTLEEAQAMYGGAREEITKLRHQLVERDRRIEELLSIVKTYRKQLEAKGLL